MKVKTCLHPEPCGARHGGICEIAFPEDCPRYMPEKKRHDKNYIQARLPPELKAKLDALIDKHKDNRYGIKRKLVVRGVRWALDRVELEGGIAWLFDEPKKEDV